MPTSKHAPRAANPIDVHVGTRVRLRRKTMKMSQEQLGDQLGITFQQVQKYERGTNRVGASRLWKISQVLEVPIQYFYDGDWTSSLPPVENGVSVEWRAYIEGGLEIDCFETGTITPNCEDCRVDITQVTEISGESKF